MRIFNTILAAIAALFMSAAIGAAHETHGGSDVEGVRHVLMHMFDKPDAPLKVEPIAVADGFAVAGWVQGEMGGRAFLRKDGGSGS